MAVENVVAVAELADLAWEKLSRRGLLNEANYAGHDGEIIAEEQLENRRLRAVVEEYKAALLTLQCKVSEVEWLRSELDSESGTLDLYDRVQKKINSPEFLQRLLLPPEIQGKTLTEVGTRFTDKNGLEINFDLESPDWWTWIDENESVKICERTDNLDGSGYVIVDHDDVIDAIANFVARFISGHPDTQDMTAPQIQEAISNAFTELKTKNLVRSFWKWGKFIYTSTSWLATAVSIYRHPVIVRATLVAIWTSTRFILAGVR